MEIIFEVSVFFIYILAIFDTNLPYLIYKNPQVDNWHFNVT